MTLKIYAKIVQTSFLIALLSKVAVWVKKSRLISSCRSSALIQGILDYRYLDYRNPRNTGICKKFQVIWLAGLSTNKPSQYRNPDNGGLGFFFDQGHFRPWEAAKIQDFLRKIGKRFCRKHKKNIGFAELSLLQMLFGCSIDSYTTTMLEKK